jgi:hypothetical protein
MCIEVSDAQFCDLTGGTANRGLVTFAARLGVVERTQSIGSDVFDFLEEFLVRLAAVGIGKPVALIVETRERFGRLRRCLAARMSCEAKEGGDCDEEQQLRGLHQTLRFTARSLQNKILILFAGVNKFFSDVLVDCNAAIHLFTGTTEKRFLWTHVGCQHSSYESLFSASTQRKHTGCWRVVGYTEVTAEKLPWNVNLSFDLLKLELMGL